MCSRELLQTCSSGLVVRLGSLVGELLLHGHTPVGGSGSACHAIFAGKLEKFDRLCVVFVVRLTEPLIRQRTRGGPAALIPSNGSTHLAGRQAASPLDRLAGASCAAPQADDAEVWAAGEPSPPTRGAKLQQLAANASDSGLIAVAQRCAVNAPRCRQAFLATEFVERGCKVLSGPTRRCPCRSAH